MTNASVSRVDVGAATDAELAARQALLRVAVPEQVERLSWSGERIAAHQRDALRSLLRTAIAGSSFHAGRLAGVEPDRFKLDDLASLPVMTKTEMMAAFDEVVTDPRVTRSKVEAHLAQTGFEA